MSETKKAPLRRLKMALCCFIYLLNSYFIGILEVHIGQTGEGFAAFQRHLILSQSPLDMGLCRSARGQRASCPLIEPSAIGK